MTTNAMPATETTSLSRALSRRRGTTLIELVMVMAIAAVLAAIAMPRYASATARRKVTAAASRLATDLDTARSQARNTSSPTTMTWTLGSGRYSWASASVRTSATTADLSRSPYETLILSLAVGGDAALVYSGLGLPDSAATIVLRSGVWQIPVSVDAVSGVASVGLISSVPAVVATLDVGGGVAE